MLSEAVEATRAAARKMDKPPPILVGVTVLTSLDEENLAELGIGRTVEEQVLGLARLALDCGLDGVVASPLEVGLLRRELGDGFVVVTPGVRPAWAGGDDQKRTTRPSEALSAGASYLVIGRPITQADDPAAALAAVIAESRSESHQSS